MGYTDELLKQDIPGIISMIKAGLDYKVFEEVAGDLGVPKQKLAKILISTYLTMRRRKTARLDMTESERLVNVILVFRQATEMFHGDSEKAGRWMTSPAFALDGHSPLIIVNRP